MRVARTGWTLGLVLSAALPATQGQPSGAEGDTIQPISFWSQALGVRKNALVWLPPSYATQSGRRYPVAYYLHGLWGSEADWTGPGALGRTLDSLTAAGLPEMIVVMPDGDDGWYTTWNWLGDYAACRRTFTPKEGDSVDSYCVPWPHYDDYVARDLVRFVDSTFRTMPQRGRRAIAGLSMGGYGAITLALGYPDVFTAAASHSGILSPLLAGGTPDQPRYAGSIEELRTRWGPRFFPVLAPAFGEDTAAWWARDPARRAARLKARAPRMMPALMLDVGTDDDFLAHSRAFSVELRKLGIPVRYAEWPGKHDWAYWRMHAAESLQWIAGQIGTATRK